MILSKSRNKLRTTKAAAVETAGIEGTTEDVPLLGYPGVDFSFGDLPDGLDVCFVESSARDGKLHGVMSFIAQQYERS